MTFRLLARRLPARRPVGALAAVALVGALAAACSSSSAPHTTRTTTAPAVTPTDLAGPGPYAAGTFQYTVGSDAVVVWYPAAKASVASRQPYTYHLRAWTPELIRKLVPASFADGVTEAAYEDVPVAAGRFPIVLFSHGYGGYPEQSTALTAHLASWGMIVIAPDQTARDLTAVISGHASSVSSATDVSQQLAALHFVVDQGTTPGSLLLGHVNGSLVATLGHSAGGGTAVLVAAADPSVRGWIALAGVPSNPPTKPVPSLMISGSLDKTVPTSTVRGFYDTVGGRKALLVIDGYGHNVFDDICTINHDHGGVVGAVQALHLPVPAGLLQLATDGCSPPDSYPPTAWPLINAAVTAQLRYDFGVPGTSTLTPAIATAFGGVTSHLTSSS